MRRAGDQIARMAVEDGARHSRGALPVTLQPDFGPLRTGQAIIREKGDERSLRCSDAAISRGPGKQPLLDIDDSYADAAIGKQRHGVAAAGIHHHDLERNILVEHRPYRSRQ
nr:hypothetical protein [Mesorhizobium sp. CA12]